MLKIRIIKNLILYLGMSSILFCQIEFETKHYTGKINNKYEIIADLEFKKNGEISGRYYYKSQRKPIILNGKFQENSVEINESLNGVINATFKGVINKNTIKGDWVGKNGKVFSFFIKEDYNESVKFINIEDEEEVLKKYNSKDSKLMTGLDFLYPSEYKNLEKIEKLREIIYKLYRQNSYGSKEDMEAGREEGKYENSMEMSVVYNKNELLVIKFETYYICGSMPHGQPRTYFSIIDLRKMKTLEVSDIFTDEYEEGMVSLIKEKLERDEEYKENENFNFFVSKNIYLTEGGVGFYYNVYEIGAYSSGSKSAVIPFEKIPKYVIKKGGILSKFIK